MTEQLIRASLWLVPVLFALGVLTVLGLRYWTIKNLEHDIDMTERKIRLCTRVHDYEQAEALRSRLYALKREYARACS